MWCVRVMMDKDKRPLLTRSPPTHPANTQMHTTEQEFIYSKPLIDQTPDFDYLQVRCFSKGRKEDHGVVCVRLWRTLIKSHPTLNTPLPQINANHPRTHQPPFPIPKKNTSTPPPQPQVAVRRQPEAGIKTGFTRQIAPALALKMKRQEAVVQALQRFPSKRSPSAAELNKRTFDKALEKVGYS